MTNPVFVLDTNIFIEAHRRYYAQDLCPGFWECLRYHSDGEKWDNWSGDSQISLTTLAKRTGLPLESSPRMQESSPRIQESLPLRKDNFL